LAAPRVPTGGRSAAAEPLARIAAVEVTVPGEAFVRHVHRAALADDSVGEGSLEVVVADDQAGEGVAADASGRDAAGDLQPALPAVDDVPLQREIVDSDGVGGVGDDALDVGQADGGEMALRVVRDDVVGED